MNVDANKIIDLYRKKVDQLQYESFILQAQVESLQAKLKEAENETAPEPEKSAE